MDNEVINKLSCFIDLHIHLDGSLPMETVKKLLVLNKIEKNYTDDDLKNILSVPRVGGNLNDYLKKFDFPVSLLQTPKAIEMAVYDLKEKLKEDGLIYAEIRFAPQKHMQRGMTIEQCVRAAIRGQEKSSLKSGLILCMMRGDDNHDLNLETIEIAKKYLGHGVCGIDLAGAEAQYPTENFKDLFDLVKSYVIPTTIHAGEAAGPRSVDTAISFGARRIGHGVRSLESTQTIKSIKDNNIALELCPTSNLNTGLFENIEEYPFKGLLNYGFKITINTDNTTVSNTSIRREFRILNNAFNLNTIMVKNLIMNSVRASFAQPNIRVFCESEIERQFKELNL